MTAKRTKRQDMEATGVFTMTGHRRHAFRTGERAYSLVEMMVALIVVGVLISMGVPRFQVSLEQALGQMRPGLTYKPSGRRNGSFGFRTGFTHRDWTRSGMQI